MNTQAHPRRRQLTELDPTPLIRTTQSRADDQKALTSSANEHFFATPHKDARVDPLWMITAAGAMLFVFLAIAVALG